MAGSPPDNGQARPASGSLSGSLSGTNLARASDFNQRTVLQLIRLSEETTRVELARVTGLTAPTIANITGRLIDLGHVRLAGRRQGNRGQPALRLTVNADGAFAIGINIDRDHVSLVAIDLAGKVRARAGCEIAFAMPDDVRACVAAELDGLLARGGVDRARVLGVGIAMPDDLGGIALPHRPDGYEQWNGIDLPRLFGDLLPWPIHVDNDAAAAALGEAQCGAGVDKPSFFYLLVSAGLGGSLVLDRSHHRGATLRSGEVGLLPDPRGAAGATVQDTVSLSALFARLEAAGCAAESVDALNVPEGDASPVIDRWIADAADTLTAPLTAVSCLIDPSAILIGGRLPMPLIERLVAALVERLAAVSLPAHAPVMPARMAEDAPAIGAAILPFLDHLLPSDAILIQAGRN